MEPSARTMAVCLDYSMYEFEDEVIQMLIRHGVDVDMVFSKGESALHLGAVLCSGKAIEMMVESGVNVNLQDDEGRIPLFNSLRNKAQENFHILLPHTDVSLKTNDGQTGLHIVLRSSRVWPVEGFCEEAVPMLIEKGVDVNALTDDKVSALSDACTLGSLQIFEALIKAGCDVNALGFGGLTVLDQVSRTITSDPSEPKTEETVLTMGKMLIDAGATVEGEYDTETSPILAAILTGKHLLVREFMLANFRIKVVRRGPGPIIQPFRELLCNFLRACCWCIPKGPGQYPIWRPAS